MTGVCHTAVNNVTLVASDTSGKTAIIGPRALANAYATEYYSMTLLLLYQAGLVKFARPSKCSRVHIECFLLE